MTEKILAQHLREGQLKRGTEIGIRMDQCLTQDSTGTMAWLEFEALGIDKVRAELAVSYSDHTSLGFKGESTDDHIFLQTIASHYGAKFSKNGNGVCHQLHYERFAVPGKTLIGSDSHTPTCGGLGMLAIGAGGMDVAVCMGGGPFFLTVPKMWGHPQRQARPTRRRTCPGVLVADHRGARLLRVHGPGTHDRRCLSNITNMGTETARRRPFSRPTT
jgi:aconitate hydratase